jgi:uncharacterized repeat protein (TIGR03843 family)
MSAIEHLLSEDEKRQADMLRRGEIVECKLVPWGSNYTFAVVLVDPAGEHDDTVGIYKPRAGEAPLWDFPSGTLYQREYASWLVSRYLGWDFIPTTVVRDGPHGIGTVQAYVEPEEDSHYFAVRTDHTDELQRMAVFDIVTNNADRKAGHCFRGRDDGRIWGIDHGLTFLYADDSIRDLLRPYLDALEIEAFRARAARTVDSGVFPELSSRRNIPYGW